MNGNDKNIVDILDGDFCTIVRPSHATFETTLVCIMVASVSSQAHGHPAEFLYWIHQEHMKTLDGTYLTEVKFKTKAFFRGYQSGVKEMSPDQDSILE